MNNQNLRKTQLAKETRVYHTFQIRQSFNHFVFHVNENSKCELYAKNNGLNTC